jgi:hypothetical protein
MSFAFSHCIDASAAAEQLEESAVALICSHKMKRKQLERSLSRDAIENPDLNTFTDVMWSTPECLQVLQQTCLSGQRDGLDLRSRELDGFITKYLKARKMSSKRTPVIQQQQQQQQQQSLLISKEALRRVTDKQLLQHELVEQMLQPAVQQDLACILELFTKFQKKQEHARVAKIAADRASLPIAAHEAAIVSAVQDNRVVIIAGERAVNHLTSTTHECTMLVSLRRCCSEYQAASKHHFYLCCKNMAKLTCSALFLSV